MMEEAALVEMDRKLLVVRDWMKVRGRHAAIVYEKLKDVIPELARACVVKYEETKSPQWGACHEAIGLKCKLKTHHWIERRAATFCSGRFYPTTDGSVLGPMIGRQLRKAMWMFNHPPSEAEGWLKSVMIGNANGWSCTPVLRVALKHYNTRLSKIQAVSFTMAERNERKYSLANQVALKHDLSMDAEEMFQLVYGYDMTHVEQVLLKILEEAPLGVYLLHPILQHIDSVDN